MKSYFTMSMLFSFLMFFSIMSCASMDTEKNIMLQAVIYQMKVVLTNQLAKKSIEEIINKARDVGGVTGNKINYYSDGKMGWSMNDIKGREVYSIIFSFLKDQAQEGKYITPLMSFQDAKILYSWHSEFLSSYFKKIDSNKYDLNDSCLAVIELFNSTEKSGRTIITIECH